MSAKTAKLQIDGIDKVIELPIYEGTTGQMYSMCAD